MSIKRGNYMDYVNDIEKTRELLSGKRNINYSKIYSSSNEELDLIVSRFDFSGRSVLSVIGSGDQAFSFYNAGVTHIDLFDINKLTIYYFYLRIWAIKYLNLLYLDDKILSSIKTVLEHVKPSSDYEMNIYNFWCEYIKSINDESIFYNGFYPLCNIKIDFDKLMYSINRDNFEFYNIDLSSCLDINKKYDFVFVSNIVDYVDNLELYRDNLYNLLNDNGVVICSNVGTYDCHNAQRVVFEKKFRYEPIVNLFGPFGNPGYYYKKL